MQVSAHVAILLAPDDIFSGSSEDFTESINKGSPRCPIYNSPFNRMIISNGCAKHVVIDPDQKSFFSLIKPPF